MKPYPELEVKIVINLLQNLKKTCFDIWNECEEDEIQYLQFSFCHALSGDRYDSIFYGCQNNSWQYNLQNEFEICLVFAEIIQLDKYGTVYPFLGINRNSWIFKMYETYCEIVIINDYQSEYFRFSNWRKAFASYCNDSIFNKIYTISKSFEQSTELFLEYTKEQKVKLHEIMKDEFLSGVDITKVKIIGYDDDGESAIKTVMTKISDLEIDKKIVNILAKQGITHMVDMLLRIHKETKIKGISENSMDQLREIMKPFDPKDKAILKEANIRVKYL